MRTEKISVQIFIFLVFAAMQIFSTENFSIAFAEEFSGGCAGNITLPVRPVTEASNVTSSQEEGTSEAWENAHATFKSGFLLVGVESIDGKGVVARIYDLSSFTTGDYFVDDKIGDWFVRAIFPSKVILEKPDTFERLELLLSGKPVNVEVRRTSVYDVTSQFLEAIENTRIEDARRLKKKEHERALKEFRDSQVPLSRK